jgi:hypothetical protein
MPVLSDAIAGSLLIAFVSLLGLIISKEMKVSEFRQAWIDALRDDLSDLISHVSAIREEHSSGDLRASELAIYKAMARIRLRLNMDGDEEKALAARIYSLGDVLTATHTTSEVQTESEQILSTAQILLKKEWEVVKAGEPVYRRTLLALSITVPFLAVALLYKLSH